MTLGLWNSRDLDMRFRRFRKFYHSLSKVHSLSNQSYQYSDPDRHECPPWLGSLLLLLHLLLFNLFVFQQQLLLKIVIVISLWQGIDWRLSNRWTDGRERRRPIDSGLSCLKVREVLGASLAITCMHTPVTSQIFTSWCGRTPLKYRIFVSSEQFMVLSKLRLRDISQP